MKTFSKVFLTGVIAVVPITLTIYVLFWLGSTAENLFGTALKFLLPDGAYRVGMGLVSGFVLIITAGLLLRAWIFHRLFVWGEQLLAKLPMVRTVYSSIRDLMKFMSQPSGSQLGQVVTVTFQEKQVTLLGFITSENVAGIHGQLPDGFVAVYLPMSYMVGGYTIMVPRDAVKPIDMPMNEAMRFALTAGMAANKKQVEDLIAAPK